jgi:hypothetical protein
MSTHETARSGYHPHGTPGFIGFLVVLTHIDIPLLQGTLSFMAEELLTN